MLVDEKVRDFIRSVASSSPTPGGGSVAALCGALSGSLTAMVCNLTIGRDKYDDVRPEMERALEDSSKLVERLTELVDEDAQAYTSVVAALRLPKGTDEEKGKRMEAMQNGLRRAIAVPVEVMELSLEAIRLAYLVVRKGNEGALSDSGSGAMLAFAALHAASMNVKINLKEIQDQEFKNEIAEKLGEMEEEAELLRSEVLTEVNLKM
ncbi:MAG: cyclodeaminase/cyclohydrolase family protein [Thermoplasmata archaeon]|nr:cyclodeaminase/cyclohydrolase family protein [Thermoplasmata archaeon]